MNYGRRNTCNTEGCNTTKSDLGIGQGTSSMFGTGGDWECPKCNNFNYARRERCNKKDCDFEKKDLDDYGSNLSFGMRAQTRPGDWDCPRCKNMNFSSREVCNGKLDGEQCNLRKPQFETWSVPEIRNSEGRRPGDWDCFRCGNINFKIREECNKCQLAKGEATDINNFRESPGGYE